MPFPPPDDLKNQGFIEADQMSQIVEEVYGTSKRTRDVMKRVASSVKRMGGRRHRLDIGAFDKFIATHPGVLYPAFAMQRQLQAHIMGEAFWRAATLKRLQSGDPTMDPREWKQLFRALIKDYRRNSVVMMPPGDGADGSPELHGLPQFPEFADSGAHDGQDPSNAYNSAYESTDYGYFDDGSGHVDPGASWYANGSGSAHDPNAASVPYPSAPPHPRDPYEAPGQHYDDAARESAVVGAADSLSAGGTGAALPSAPPEDTALRSMTTQEMALPAPLQRIMTHDGVTVSGSTGAGSSPISVSGTPVTAGIPLVPTPPSNSAASGAGGDGGLYPPGFVGAGGSPLATHGSGAYLGPLPRVDSSDLSVVKSGVGGSRGVDYLGPLPRDDNDGFSPVKTSKSHKRSDDGGAFGSSEAAGEHDSPLPHPSAMGAPYAGPLPHGSGADKGAGAGTSGRGAGDVDSLLEGVSEDVYRKLADSLNDSADADKGGKGRKGADGQAASRHGTKGALEHGSAERIHATAGPGRAIYSSGAGGGGGGGGAEWSPASGGTYEGDGYVPGPGFSQQHHEFQAHAAAARDATAPVFALPGSADSRLIAGGAASGYGLTDDVPIGGRGHDDGLYPSGFGSGSSVGSAGGRSHTSHPHGHNSKRRERSTLSEKV